MLTYLYFNHIIMIKTKIKKALAVAWITAIIASAIGAAGLATSYATQIGTGSVTGTSAFDSPIDWDDTFGGGSNATGSVSDILVKATVDPTLNMEISAEEIDLGTLAAGVESTGSLNIEIGTNAADGVSITARSQSGGLTNTTDNAIQINSDATDGIAGESYRFASALDAADDSSYTTFTSTAALDADVADNTTEHTVYTSNKPEATNGVNDILFTVKATSQAETAAGLYEDRITFTVTGNF